MAEQRDEDDRPQDAGEVQPSAPRPNGDPPGLDATHVAYGTGGVTRPPGEGRFRRWSRSAPAQFAAVGLLAGLVGGLVGGGIVAAVDGNDHDHPQFVRIERGVPPRWDGRRFDGPRRGPFFPMRPGRPAEPRPTPTTTS